MNFSLSPKKITGESWDWVGVEVSVWLREIRPITYLMGVSLRGSPWRSVFDWRMLSTNEKPER